MSGILPDTDVPGISFTEPWAQGLSWSSDSELNRCQVENSVDGQLSPEQASLFELS
jgi:hypothetical protein